MLIKNLGIIDYGITLKKMREFTASRTSETLDEIWILEHNAVFTQGQAGKPEHILKKTNIPIIQSDRGGQVTYHGPGQIIIYPLLNIKRHSLTIKNLICRLEQSVINLLNRYNISSTRKENAPGVYVDGKKISALGLRITKGYCYHGLSFNVDMDLTPFTYINPCGYNNLEVTQLKDLGVDDCINNIKDLLLGDLIEQLEM